MTCIAAWVDREKGEVWMGGDSAGTDNWCHQVIQRDPKVFRRGDLLFGCAGSLRMKQLLQHALEAPRIPEGQAIDAYLATTFAESLRSCFREHGWLRVEHEQTSLNDSSFLVAGQGRVFRIQENLSYVEPQDPYLAAGMGYRVAEGVLMATWNQDIQPENRIKMALRVVEHLDSSVRSPFHVEKI